MLCEELGGSGGVEEDRIKAGAVVVDGGGGGTFPVLLFKDALPKEAEKDIFGLLGIGFVFAPTTWVKGRVWR